MPDAKIEDLVALTAPAIDDLLAIVDDPSGTPITKKVTLSNLCVFNTWTPVIGGSGGTSGQSYSRQAGRYVKIGRLVFVSWDIILSAKGTITDNVQIHGLPFTVVNALGVGATGLIRPQNLATNWVLVVANAAPNTTVAAVLGTQAAAAGWVTLTTTDIGNTTAFEGSLVYEAGA